MYAGRFVGALFIAFSLAQVCGHVHLTLKRNVTLESAAVKALPCSCDGLHNSDLALVGI